MTVTIRFKGPTDRLAFADETGPHASEGEVDLGGIRESFLATHVLWSREAYEDDWARNARRLELGKDCYFVTNMEPRVEGATIWVWPVFRCDGKVLATQSLVGQATRGDRFLTEELGELVDFDTLRQSFRSGGNFFELMADCDP